MHHRDPHDDPPAKPPAIAQTGFCPSPQMMPALRSAAMLSSENPSRSRPRPRRALLKLNADRSGKGQRMT
jgi:hypothetical protein